MKTFIEMSNRMESKFESKLICTHFVFIAQEREGDTWRVDQKDGKDRCILKCSDGYVPSGCHVISPRHGGGYNIAIPICEKAPYVSSETLLAAGACAGVVVAIPYDLKASGFTAAGGPASAFASFLQGLMGDSLISAMWAAGASGIGAGTKPKLVGVCFTTAEYVKYTYIGCEAE